MNARTPMSMSQLEPGDIFEMADGTICLAIYPARFGRLPGRSGTLNAVVLQRSPNSAEKRVVPMDTCRFEFDITPGNAIPVSGDVYVERIEGGLSSVLRVPPQLQGVSPQPGFHPVS